MTKKNNAVITSKNVQQAQTALSGAQVLFEITGQILALYQMSQNSKINQQEISAKRDIIIESIRQENLQVEQYLKNRFEERDTAIKAMVELLRDGMQKNNTEMIDKALNGIGAVLDANPLDDFEKFSAWRNSPNRPQLEI